MDAQYLLRFTSESEESEAEELGFESLAYASATFILADLSPLLILKHVRVSINLKRWVLASDCRPMFVRRMRSPSYDDRYLHLHFLPYRCSSFDALVAETMSFFGLFGASLPASLC